MRFSRRHQSAVYRAVALALFGMAVPVKATNLLVNPSFEAPTAGGTPAVSVPAGPLAIPPTLNERIFQADIHSGTWALW